MVPPMVPRNHTFQYAAPDADRYHMRFDECFYINSMLTYFNPLYYFSWSDWLCYLFIAR